MGYRTIDQVLSFDRLQEGSDPTYLDEQNALMDVVYLGLAGELAKEFKCPKITLPMLSTDQYDWKKELRTALQKTILQKPQVHVNSFAHAYSDFTKEMSKEGLSEDGPIGYNSQSPSIWFSNRDTRLALVRQLKFVDNGRYYINKYEDHYFVDRCSLILDLPSNIICMIPSSEHFGALAINEQRKFFNFFFFPNMIRVYRLKDLKINHEDLSVHNAVFE